MEMDYLNALRVALHERMIIESPFFCRRLWRRFSLPIDSLQAPPLIHARELGAASQSRWRLACDQGVNAELEIPAVSCLKTGEFHAPLFCLRPRR